MKRKSGRVNFQKDRENTLRSLSNNDGDVNKNDKKSTGLDSQNNNFPRSSRFFCTFLKLYRHCKLRRENA